MNLILIHLPYNFVILFNANCTDEFQLFPFLMKKCFHLSARLGKSAPQSVVDELHQSSQPP